MNFNMLGGSFSLPDGFFPTPTGKYAFLAPLVQFLNEAIIPISLMLLLLAMVFSVILGFMIAKAESSEKSQDMKRRLFRLFVAIFAVIGAMWALAFVLGHLNDIMATFRGK